VYLDAQRPRTAGLQCRCGELADKSSREKARAIADDIWSTFIVLSALAKHAATRSISSDVSNKRTSLVITGRNRHAAPAADDLLFTLRRLMMAFCTLPMNITARIIQHRTPSCLWQKEFSTGNRQLPPEFPVDEQGKLHLSANDLERR